MTNKDSLFNHGGKVLAIMTEVKEEMGMTKPEEAGHYEQRL